MRNHELYEIYVAYLSTLRINKSEMRLFEISKTFFDNFIKRYKNDAFFRMKNSSKFLSAMRDKKLKNILNAHDSENKPS